MAGNVVIRPVGKDERAAWQPLWNGYLAFYEATLAPGASDVVCESNTITKQSSRGRVAHNHNGNLAEYPFKKVPKQFLERRDAPFVFSQRNNERRRKHEEDFLRSRRLSDHRGCGAYSGKR
jgi:hypothetical protein